MANEWVVWHQRYGTDRLLIERLRVVQNQVRAALDRSPPGVIRVISMCSGDGRDLLGALDGHPRRHDVRARLVELTPELATAGRAVAARLGLTRVKFVVGDASTTTAYEGAVPGDLVLVCGVFGNISDRDVRHTVEQLPRLCARNATVVWTRGRFEPDLTPRIRSWFRRAGFDELAFVPIPGTTATVGAHRMCRAPLPFRSGVRLFAFLPKEQRPSTKGRSSPGPTRSRRPPEHARTAGRRRPDRIGPGLGGVARRGSGERGRLADVVPAEHPAE